MRVGVSARISFSRLNNVPVWLDHVVFIPHLWMDTELFPHFGSCE